MRKNMRKKWMKRAVAATLSVALLATCTGCGGNGKKSGKTTLNINILNEFKNLDKVLDVYYDKVQADEVLKDVDLNVTYFTGGDYSEKLSMAMNAQENYDLMFIGAWHGIDNYISQGLCADLTKYFNNDEYPGLKKAFSEEVVEANMTYEKNENGEYEAKLYKIPIMEAINDTRGLYIREDLRKKYNIPEITNDEILEEFLTAIKENEPDILPWSNYGLFYFGTPYYSAPHDNVFPAEVLSSVVPFYVALSDDYSEVKDIVVMGDTQEHFDNMPEGYQYDFIKEYHMNRTKWGQFMDPNRGDKDTNMYTEWAASYGVVTGYESTKQDLLQDEEFMERNPDFELSFYVTEDSQRNREKGAVFSEMSQGNFLVVPEWSENIDEVMHFLDWMFASEENHDLFQYGIEGVDWEKVDDETYRTLEVPEQEKYSIAGYSLTWNPNYIKINENIANNKQLKEYAEYQNDFSTYQLSPLAGFVFNTEPVRTKFANVTAKTAELDNLGLAIYGDETSDVIDKWYQDVVKVGLNDIRDEYIKQLQEFLTFRYGNK